jgi:2-polyprenyl-6-methoxyphenol hydroxylase-like FAD-dependent oxidoreductase
MNRSHSTSTDPIPVVIVGAGPVGVSAAILLGQYGVDCLVLDRWDGVYPQPRAVHLDDEIYRILARLGVAEQFAGNKVESSTHQPNSRRVPYDHALLASAKRRSFDCISHRSLRR